MRLALPFFILLAIVLGCSAPPQTSNAPASPTPVPTPIPAFAELKKQAEDLLAQYKKDPDAPIHEPIKETAKALATITDPKNVKAAADLKKKLDDVDLKITNEIALLGPKPEQSKFNATVGPVDEYLRRNLNDYSSSEYVEWSPVTKIRDKDGPFWGVRLRLRAKNAFGGMILRDTYYYMRQGQVVKTKGLDG